MILINFAHPVTEEQQKAIEEHVDQKIKDIIKVPSQVDLNQPLESQIKAMADKAGLSVEAWQTEVIIINPPALSTSTALLMAELHGRMGYFPACLRLRAIPDSLPRKFEFAEIMNLQGARDRARAR